jgi:glycosyltransferase involved in cell wall biosynthesis
VNSAASVPAVSVVLCLYNGERFLTATLNSLFQQSYSDFELIVVDDGSIDRSTEIVERNSDSRIRLIRQQRQGAAAALDAGLQAARGEYIALLDQDDLWMKDKLANHIETHRKHPEIDITFSWFRVINDDGHEIGLHSNRFRGTIDFRDLLVDFVIGASSNVVVRKSAIERSGGVDRTLPRLYDLDLCVRVAMLAPRNILAISQDLMLYRRHSLQITRDLTSLELEWERTLRKYEGLALDDFQQLARRANSNMNRYFAALSYEERSYRRALEFLKKGWRDSASHFLIDRRNWLTLSACLSGLLLPVSIHQRLERLAGLHREVRTPSNLSPLENYCLSSDTPFVPRANSRRSKL